MQSTKKGKTEAQSYTLCNILFPTQWWHHLGTALIHALSPHCQPSVAALCCVAKSLKCETLKNFSQKEHSLLAMWGVYNSFSTGGKSYLPSLPFSQTVKLDAIVMVEKPYMNCSYVRSSDRFKSYLYSSVMDTRSLSLGSRFPQPVFSNRPFMAWHGKLWVPAD